MKCSKSVLIERSQPLSGKPICLLCVICQASNFVKHISLKRELDYLDESIAKIKKLRSVGRASNAAFNTEFSNLNDDSVHQERRVSKFPDEYKEAFYRLLLKKFQAQQEGVSRVDSTEREATEEQLEVDDEVTNISDIKPSVAHTVHIHQFKPRVPGGWARRLAFHSLRPLLDLTSGEGAVVSAEEFELAFSRVDHETKARIEYLHCLFPELGSSLASEVYEEMIRYWRESTTRQGSYPYTLMMSKTEAGLAIEPYTPNVSGGEHDNAGALRSRDPEALFGAGAMEACLSFNLNDVRVVAYIDSEASLIDNVRNIPLTLYSRFIKQLKEFVKKSKLDFGFALAQRFLEAYLAIHRVQQLGKLLLNDEYRASIVSLEKYSDWVSPARVVSLSHHILAHPAIVTHFMEVVFERSHPVVDTRREKRRALTWPLNNVVSDCIPMRENYENRID